MTFGDALTHLDLISQYRQVIASFACNRMAVDTWFPSLAVSCQRRAVEMLSRSRCGPWRLHYRAPPCCFPKGPAISYLLETKRESGESFFTLKAEDLA
jgi:hypothetical protein